MLAAVALVSGAVLQAMSWLLSDRHLDMRTRFLGSLAGVWLLAGNFSGSHAALRSVVWLIEAVAVGAAVWRIARWWRLRRLHPGARPQRAADFSHSADEQLEYYLRSGQLSALEAAIGRYRDAVELSVGDSWHTVYLASLMMTMRARAEHRGTVSDLDAAVELGCAALPAISVHDPRRGRFLSQLAQSFRARYLFTGDAVDLSEAIALARRAVQATGARHKDRIVCLAGLATVQAAIFDRTDDVADLTEAINTREQILQQINRNHDEYLSNLVGMGHLLFMRANQTGFKADLDRALALTREGMRRAPRAGGARASCGLNLCLAAKQAYERRHEDMLIEEAVAAGRMAVDAAPPGTALAARCSGAYGDALCAQAVMTGDAATLAEGLKQLRDAAQSETAPGATRVTMAVTWGHRAAAAQLWTQAADGLELAVDLLVQQVSQPLRRPDQEHRLGRWPYVATSAATCAVLADDKNGPARAVAILEKGRGVLLAQTLHSHMARDTEYPTAAGPIVVLNVSLYGSHALLITDSAIDCLALPEAGLPRVLDQARVLLTAAYSIDPAARTPIMSVLEWLWNAVTGPVLDKLGLCAAGTLAPEWPRVCWIPTGPLAFFPIHAAGLHHPCECATPLNVMDRVVSSYSPTIGALPPAGVWDSAGYDARPLVVALPQTPGQRPLQGAAVEEQQFMERYPAALALIGEDAVCDAVLRELPARTMAHFACHAHADLIRPSDGCILLHDHITKPLTAAMISPLNLRGIRLVYLSACATGQPGDQLADEAVHLASAFRAAGSQQVIATLWPILDVVAAKMAKDFYVRLADGVDPGMATHLAAQAIRAEYAQRPYIWAPYLHFGR